MMLKRCCQSVHSRYLETVVERLGHLAVDNRQFDGWYNEVVGSRRLERIRIVVYPQYY